jgi:hexosaminidase
MNKFISLICCFLLYNNAYSQQAGSGNDNLAGPVMMQRTEDTSADSTDKLTNKPPEFAIIPEPVSLLKTNGYFTLPENVVIMAHAGPELKNIVDYLQQKITVPTGKFVSAVSASAPAATIRLMLNTKDNQLLGTEGYQLSVTPTLIVIKANKPAGLFYGVQSLLQLFPKEIESKEQIEDVKWTIPCVEITDYPRVGWRGLMFDVARHFFTKQEVKQYIDAMVRYKYNLLHLHLADDEGWRLEIKGLPKLTEVGAWSVKKVGEFGTFSIAAPGEPRTYGGFYTQDDIKEIISYAKDRFVDILPEIDVPGHSLAAIASYPELSTTAGIENPKVRSGEKIMDWSKGAPPIAMVDNTLNPANERVYSFLDTVITQIAALFPFDYIHMGGDEAPVNYWQKSDSIKALMQKEGLKDMHQVQGYFEKRIQKIVESKGKKFIGWDEILNGDMPASAAIMSWRSSAIGIDASLKKHEVVMAPQTNVYLDLMQGDVVTEAKVYNTVRLSKAYEFDPVPPGADPKYIKGGQGNLWTEQIYNIRQAEYMTWPRGYAIAESVWSPKEKKNWINFIAKMELHFKRMDVAETKYAPSVYDPVFKVSRSADRQLMVELSTEIEGLDIYYSFDNSFPDRFYPKYTEKLVPPKDATQLRVITYRGKQPVGRMVTMPVSELNRRAGIR